ncbi:MAG TPA: YlmC/YmxH family sporulation protein [Firmicutes bacterium]|nr:YlmC/YmxH family sporulation protein [Bacillota bacterium]
MLITSSELRQREVVNLVDGRRLGTLYDLELAPDTGEIRALILPEIEGRFFWRRVNEVQIPWSQVVMIGVDYILVESPELADPSYMSLHRRPAGEGREAKEAGTTREFHVEPRREREPKQVSPRGPGECS